MPACTLLVVMIHCCHPYDAHRSTSTLTPGDLRPSPSARRAGERGEACCAAFMLLPGDATESAVDDGNAAAISASGAARRLPNGRSVAGAPAATRCGRLLGLLPPHRGERRSCDKCGVAPLLAAAPPPLGAPRGGDMASGDSSVALTSTALSTRTRSGVDG